MSSCTAKIGPRRIVAQNWRSVAVSLAGRRYSAAMPAGSTSVTRSFMITFSSKSLGV